MIELEEPIVILIILKLEKLLSMYPCEKVNQVERMYLNGLIKLIKEKASIDE